MVATQHSASFLRQSSLRNQSSLKPEGEEEEEEEEWETDGTPTKKEYDSALIPPPKIPGNVEASCETYFGEAMLASLQAQKDGGDGGSGMFGGFTRGGSFINSSRSKSSSKIPSLLNLSESHDTACHEVLDHQRMVMRMYENRFASLQRLVSFFVLFHAMGKRVRDFWTYCSFGLLGYEIDRTHSIMRIATTASPVSGAAIRDEMLKMAMQTQWKVAQMKLSSLMKLGRLNGKISWGKGLGSSSSNLAGLGKSALGSSNNLASFQSNSSNNLAALQSAPPYSEPAPELVATAASFDQPFPTNPGLSALLFQDVTGPPTRRKSSNSNSGLASAMSQQRSSPTTMSPFSHLHSTTEAERADVRQSTSFPRRRNSGGTDATKPVKPKRLELKTAKSATTLPVSSPNRIDERRNKARQQPSSNEKGPVGVGSGI